MKKNIYIKALLLCLLSISFSCEKLVENLNTDPNNPTDASATLLLTAAQLGNISVQEGHLARVASMWSGYFTGSDRQYKDVDSYNITGSDFNNVWGFVYQGVVEQTKLIIEKSERTNNRLIQGIAKITRANSLGTAVACFGDIPYTEASNIDLYPNPAFESQSSVYASLQLLLDDAIADLQSGAGSSPDAADIHFNGDGSKWLQTAYTLKSRFYLETKEYALAEEASSNGITSSDASLKVTHGNSLNVNENLMYAFIGRNRVGDINAATALAPTLLDPASPDYKGNAKTDETARFNYHYITVNPSGTVIPVMPNVNSSPNSLGLFGQTASYPLVTFEENILTTAESKARLGKTGESLAALNTYRAYLNGGGGLDPTYLSSAFSYKYEAYALDDFSTGGVLHSTGLSTNDALLKEILMERYITFNGQILGFNDLRRTRKEDVGVNLTPTTGNILPERMIYSEAEINSNTSAPNPIPGVFVVTPVNL
jgi:hypothetical protein